MSTVNDKNVQFSEYSGKFIDQVNSTDKLRAESMTRLQGIRRARQKSQQRQLKRMTERFGEEHPRVVRQAERIVNERVMESYLVAAISKSDAEIEIPKGSFVFRGRIFGDGLRGTEGIVVQLQDSRNNVIGKPVITDENGVYSLVLTINESFKLKKATAVVLEKGIQVHKEKLPVQIKADTVELRDIVLVKEKVSSPRRRVVVKKDGQNPSKVVKQDKIVENEAKVPVNKEKAPSKRAVRVKQVRTRTKPETKKS